MKVSFITGMFTIAKLVETSRKGALNARSKINGLHKEQGPPTCTILSNFTYIYVTNGLAKINGSREKMTSIILQRALVLDTIIVQLGPDHSTL